MTKLPLHKIVKRLSFAERIRRSLFVAKVVFRQKYESTYSNNLVEGLTSVIARVAHDPTVWTDVSCTINVHDDKTMSMDGSVYFDLPLTDEEVIALHTTETK